MKNKILIFALFVLVLGGVAWGMLRSQKIDKGVTPVTTEEKNTQNNAVNLETITLPSEKPASFGGIKMVVYKNPHGYEVTYPADWDKLGLPDTYGDQRDDTIHHYFSPYPVNEELHRLLLKPIGCEDETSCDKYFEKYSKKDYSLFETYIQMFNRGITLPDMQIPDAKKMHLIFPDGAKGVMWTQNINKTRVIIIDDTKKNYRYHITIGNPQEYGISQEEALWVLSTFKIE